MARRELQQKIQLRLGEMNATLMCQHNSLVMTVNAALGGGPKAGPVKPGENGVKDLAQGHSSVEDAVAAINSAMLF